MEYRLYRWGLTPSVVGVVFVVAVVSVVVVVCVTAGEGVDVPSSVACGVWVVAVDDVSC